MLALIRLILLATCFLHQTHADAPSVSLVAPGPPSGGVPATGYAAPPAPAPASSYGAPPPPAPTYGAPPAPTYGAPPAPTYGAPPAPTYGAPPAPTYGAPKDLGSYVAPTFQSGPY